MARRGSRCPACGRVATGFGPRCAGCGGLLEAGAPSPSGTALPPRGADAPPRPTYTDRRFAFHIVIVLLIVGAAAGGVWWLSGWLSGVQTEREAAAQAAYEQTPEYYERWVQMRLNIVVDERGGARLAGEARNEGDRDIAELVVHVSYWSEVGSGGQAVSLGALAAGQHREYSESLGTLRAPRQEGSPFLVGQVTTRIQTIRF